MTTNPGSESNGGTDDSDGPIVENSTVSNATVVIHAHPWQTPVDIVTESIDIQLLVHTCRLNGVEYSNPDRPLTISDADVTHDPRTSELDIRT